MSSSNRDCWFNIVKKTLAAIAAAIVLSVPPAARADDNNNLEVFAGADTTFYNTVFAGASIALPGSTLNRGFSVRGSAFDGGYVFADGVPGPIHATFAGAQLQLEYQFSTPHFWSSFGGGARYEDTHLTPFDPNAVRRGQQTEFVGTLTGGAAEGPWREDWWGWYGSRIGDYQTYVDLTHQVTPRWRLGVATLMGGDPTYHGKEIGPIAGVEFGTYSELHFSVGKAWQSGFNSRAYASLGFHERI
jgi:hypothetical protein